VERTNQQHANQFVQLVDHKRQCFVLCLIGSIGKRVSFGVIERCSDVNSGVITH